MRAIPECRTRGFHVALPGRLTFVSADDGTDTTRVVIADDHAVVRRGTRQMLEHAEAGIVVVGEAADGHDAVRMVEELLPDVAILDIGLPGLNGIEATRHIKEAHPSVGVLVLTVQDADEYVWRSIQAGASGYLLKDADDDELVDAVRIVAAGGARLDPAVTDGVLARLRRGENEGPGAVLTTRETEVLRLAARGLSNRAIGEKLEISPRTVEVHMGNLFEKIGATSRTEAVVLAARRGIVDLDGGTP
jgi:DNA-binding NarL/FixJ family response regulator